MIVAHHVIFGMYGFWLPNDPRGSWSDFVGSWELFRYGPATKTTKRTSVASRPHDHSQRIAAKTALKRSAVKLNGLQARAVGRGFAHYAERSRLLIWECAILPDHVHLVLGQMKMNAKQTVIQLKGAATEQLVEENLHPFHGREKCFARGEWIVFLDPPDVSRAIRYVADNPTKEGLPRQRWPFVTPSPHQHAPLARRG